MSAAYRVILTWRDTGSQQTGLVVVDPSPDRESEFDDWVMFYFDSEADYRRALIDGTEDFTLEVCDA
jgi:hypothetical protein